MSEQLSSPPATEPPSEHASPAEIIALPPPDLSQLHIEDYSRPSEFVSIFANIWLHPNIEPHKLAERICVDTSDDDNAWRQRLYSIFKEFVSSDLTEEQETDPVLTELADFLKKSKAFPHALENERRAARILYELSSAMILDNSDPTPVGAVFMKMTHTIPSQ